MNLNQKFRLIKETILNLWWSLTNEKFALNYLADTSVGYHIRATDQEMYKIILSKILIVDGENK